MNNKILLTIISILLTFLFLELMLRFYQYISFNQPLIDDKGGFSHDLLGWEAISDFGSIDTNKEKIFVIGDSFTDGNSVEKDKIYYSYLKNDNTELFAYGGPGYGSLQELLVLRMYLNSINPDLIIIQITSNDIINNSIELEKKSYFNNNFILRPYYSDNGIKKMFPSSLNLVRYNLVKYSRLFRNLFYMSDQIFGNLARKKILNSVEDKISLEGENYLEYKNAVDTTFEIFNQIVIEAGGIPVVFMPADVEEPYFTSYQKIVSKLDAVWMHSPAKKIENRRTKGEQIFQEDGAHWNNAGHKYVGTELQQRLIELNLIKNFEVN